MKYSCFTYYPIDNFASICFLIDVVHRSLNEEYRLFWKRKI